MEGEAVLAASHATRRNTMFSPRLSMPIALVAGGVLLLVLRSNGACTSTFARPLLRLILRRRIHRHLEVVHALRPRDASRKARAKRAPDGFWTPAPAQAGPPRHFPLSNFNGHYSKISSNSLRV